MSADIPKIIRVRRQVYAYDLDGADLIRSLTDEELSQIYNGIGPAWFTQEMRDAADRLTPDMQPCAMIHDVEYSAGNYADVEGPHSRYDFHAANKRLKANGYKIAKAKYPWLEHPIKRLVLRSEARAYAKICEAFGWSSWVKGHTTSTKGATA